MWAQGWKRRQYSWEWFWRQKTAQIWKAQSLDDECCSVQSINGLLLASSLWGDRFFCPLPILIWSNWWLVALSRPFLKNYGVCLWSPGWSFVPQDSTACSLWAHCNSQNIAFSSSWLVKKKEFSNLWSC